MQRAQIKMIEVCVREQHEIDSWQVRNFKRGRGQPFRADREARQANSDPWKQRRIGQDVDPEKVDQNSRVTEPRQSEASVIPRSWLRPRERRRDGMPAFDRPFAPKIGNRGG